MSLKRSTVILSVILILTAAVLFFYPKQRVVGGLVVRGFNPITVVLAIGDPFLMTDSAYVVWRLEEGVSWRLWLIAPDPFEMLPQSSNVPPGEDQTQVEGEISPLDENEVQLVVGEVLELFQDAEVEIVANRVQDEGLIIAPFSTDAPEEGLIGVPLKKALETMLRGADPQVVALDTHVKRKIGIVITGLNPAKITPAVGDEVVISSPSLLTLDLEQNGEWQLDTISVDSDLKLLDAIEEPPYEVWTPDPSTETLSPQIRAVIATFADMLRRGDPLEVSLHVPPEGLLITPYGLGAPERGLSGEPLLQTLEELLAEAEPEIVAFDLTTPGRVGLVVRGLNKVDIKPASGEPMRMTDPTFVSLVLGPEGRWGFWLLAPDTFDVLIAALDSPPFVPWK